MEIDKNDYLVNFEAHMGKGFVKKKNEDGNSHLECTVDLKLTGKQDTIIKFITQAMKLTNPILNDNDDVKESEDKPDDTNYLND